MGKLLALDYGTRRVGIAISDETHSHVFIRKTIDLGSTKKLTVALTELVRVEDVEKLVFGLPLSLDGSEGPQAASIRAVATRISSTLRIPVEFEDERYTSSYADRFKGSSGDRDSIAAAAILESYLERTARRTP
ncbi:MAG: Holliday junction resolvase RuvX [Candidatus Kerfeldbacteria bacterium]